MPESRLQRTREAYEGEVAFAWTGCGWCTQCHRLHSSREACAQPGSVVTIRHSDKAISCPCDACVQKLFA